MELKGLRKFHDALKSTREKEDFRRHMRKYISIWMPDCPFEVSTTNRYTIIAQEAAITARRSIKKGDAVKYLVGNLVAMTPDEEKDLDLTRRDFSIVMSSRKKTPSLFLGPARFANHDCNANARLVTRGSEGMQVVAVRDIEVGDEITVTYGDNYFGEGNCECLCVTCETNCRGAWVGSLMSRSATPLEVDEQQSPRPYSFRRLTRKLGRQSESLPSSSPELDCEQPIKRRVNSKSKIGSAHTCGGLDVETKNFSRNKRNQSDERSDVAEEHVGGWGSRKRAKIEYPSSRWTLGKQFSKGSLRELGQVTRHTSTDKMCTKSLADDNKAPLLVRCIRTQSAEADDCSPRLDSIPDVSEANFDAGPISSTKFSPSDPAASYDLNNKENCEMTSVVQLLPPSPNNTVSTGIIGNVAAGTPNTASDPGSVFDNDQLQVSSPATSLSGFEHGLEWKPRPQSSDNISDSELSELEPDAEIDDTAMIIKTKPAIIKKAPRASKILPTIEIESTATRVPGDYSRTPQLLGEKYSRWVDCRTCLGCWVQQNGYQTRKECPRCERHSKLYGYQWPKTEKQGKSDLEERVMDHRTVHRFIRPEEERQLVKRGRGVVRLGSDSASRTQSVDTDHGPIARLRGSARAQRGSHLAL